MTTNKQRVCNIFWRLKTPGKQVKMRGNGMLFLKQDTSQRMTHENDDRKPLQNITGGGGMSLQGTSRGLRRLQHLRCVIVVIWLNTPHTMSSSCHPILESICQKLCLWNQILFYFCLIIYFYLKWIRNRTSGPEHNNMCPEQSWLKNRNTRQTSGMTK